MTSPPGEVRPGSYIADQVGYAGDSAREPAGAGPAHDTFAHVQGEELLQGAWLRPMPAVEPTYYLGYPHPELKRMLDDGNDPAQVCEQGAAWTALGNVFVEFRDSIDQAITANSAEWSGSAAAAALGRAADISIWFGHAAQGAQLTGNRLATQSEAAQWARDTMPDPVEFSISAAQAGQLTETDPIRFAQGMAIEDRFHEQQAAHQHAAEIVQTYDAGLVESGATLPAFAPPPDLRGGHSGSMTPLAAEYGDHTTAQSAAQSTGGGAGPAANIRDAGPAVGGRPREEIGQRSQLDTGAGPAVRPGGPTGGAMATRGGVAGRGAAGVPLSGRANRGEEDAEHQRPDYLVEPDPNEIFGNNQVTVKPVIGE